MRIDVEGLVWLFNRYEQEAVPADVVVADVAAHDIPSADARAALQQALDSGRLEWVGVQNVRRPA